MGNIISTTVTDNLLVVLADAGVRHVFGVPGDAINAVVDGIRRHPELTFVHVRHEEAGAFAASAQAKLTGKLTAVVGTSGPGAAHLLNGLADASRDHAPVIAVTGQTDTSLLGTSAHQELDQHDLFSAIAAFSEMIVHPDQMPSLAIEACRAAMSTPGVAHLALPANLASQTVHQPQYGTVQQRESRLVPHPDDLSEAATLLRNAQRPVILAGIGAGQAVPQLLDIAERLGAPIIKTLRAKALIPDDHPLTVGGLGLLGTRAAVNAIESCDALLMVGTDFPYRDFYPDIDVPAVQIDIEPRRIGRRFPVQVGLVGNANETLTALAAQLPHREDRRFLERAQQDMATWRRQMRRFETSDSVPLRPERLAAAVGAHLTDDAIVVCDTGTVTAWVARHLAIRERQSFTLSGNLASMAYGLPAAIGAQLAYPDRQVVALVGDGSFTMLPSDLITAVELDLPITIVIFDNRKLGLITVEEESEGFAEQQTALPPCDLAAVAEAFGAHGYRITAPDELEPTLARALSEQHPTVVDVLVDPDELIVPPRIEMAQALGYAEAKIKEFFGVGQQDGGTDVITDVLR
jgi:thiamine pyrophosphate-dependent acetolactate synthase large subunit-like protein